jgi:hypothetical protein
MMQTCADLQLSIPPFQTFKHNRPPGKLYCTPDAFVNVKVWNQYVSSTWRNSLIAEMLTVQIEMAAQFRSQIPRSSAFFFLFEIYVLRYIM